jgi:hypothetical protein
MENVKFNNPDRFYITREWFNNVIALIHNIEMANFVGRTSWPTEISASRKENSQYGRLWERCAKDIFRSDYIRFKALGGFQNRAASSGITWLMSLTEEHRP